MDWLITSLSWYFFIFSLGLIFFPLTTKIFKNFPFDQGYPFAKVFAIIFVSYITYVLGTVKILSLTRVNLFLIIGFLLLVNVLLYLKNKKSKPIRTFLYVFILEEILFLSSFLFWTYIRGQEPSIRSLEKFMDFGFINSILRAEFFPPLDMWYSGNYPINYYYFGHLTGATLIKLVNINPAIGYNLILSTIFALGVTEVFSIVTNIIKISSPKISLVKNVFYGVIGAFIVNLGGNLHTIYLFTKGYPTNENPIPFWKIFSGFNPQNYWYPNATRFIPYTIHEFPSYSYVVADLHGHVFDIPFVLFTLAILLKVFLYLKQKKYFQASKIKNEKLKVFKNIPSYLIAQLLNYFKLISNNFKKFASGGLILTIFLSFLTAIHYMTNAFDGPIYTLLTLTIFLFLFGFSKYFFLLTTFYLLFAILFTLPFSFHFKPFVSGIGVNCGSEIFKFSGKIGPFLFEKNNCQISPFWMLFILWGFFWVNFIMFIITKKTKNSKAIIKPKISSFTLVLFSFANFLILIPEFFYAKDIYPVHFRANTMFKLGYQAFIMMGIASAYVFFLLKHAKIKLFIIIYSLLFILVSIYPFFSIPSYYGSLNKPVNLDGSSWFLDNYPEDKEIIDWLNKNVKGQPVILEAQGDSYTDYERISTMTGLPTVAGWWVHEWLWRGSADVVGKRIPDITAIYESKDINQTKQLIKKYQIKYIVVSRLEKQKYPNIYEEKFLKIGKIVLRTNNGFGALYKVD